MILIVTNSTFSLKYPGHFSLVHERFAANESLMETNKTVEQWKYQLQQKLKVKLITRIREPRNIL